MDIKTIVLPTSRSIRLKLEEDKKNIFLDNYISAGEFFSKAVIVENLSLVDDDTRVIMLLKASDFKNFKKLNIKRNFFTFTKNSSYIFDFYHELFVENVSIDDLMKFDIYDEYEEHLSILKELLLEYEKLLLSHNLYDKIFVPKYYKLNLSFIKVQNEIEFVLSGFLSAFELKILQEISEYKPVYIIFNATKYNEKMIEKFNNLGFDLRAGYKYRLDLKNKKQQTLLKRDESPNLSLSGVSQKILQVAIVKQKVYEFLEKGYEPQKIGVILPDESLKDFIELFI
jgi:hypothetical protein